MTRLAHLLVSYLIFLGVVASASAQDHRYFHENVLGTSLEIVVRAKSADDAGKAEAAVLKEIDRWQTILSSYDKTSEFSKLLLNKSTKPTAASVELIETLQISDRWVRASKGAYNPAVELLSKIWQQGQKNDQVPNAEEIAKAVSKIQGEHWKIDAAGKKVTRTSDVPLTLNAVGKGVILDRVVEHVMKNVDGVQGMLVNIGGDLRVAGDCKAQVDIADPSADSIGAKPLTSLNLSNVAVATSGHSERFLQIGDKKYSHIIDPRSGHSVKESVSATVIADSASTADAVATICSVMTIEESIQFVNKLKKVDCLLVNIEGKSFSSKNFPKAMEVKTSTKRKMLVEFEISKPRASRRYRRPYVAVWIEDSDKQPVRTLSLFLMQNRPGPRWYRDLRRWYASDQLKKFYDDRDIIKTVSKPTRNPGKYNVSWDGLDDNGKPLKPGTYTFLIESAREHGTYQLIKHEFELDKDFKKELKGNVEISAASIDYKAVVEEESSGK